MSLSALLGLNKNQQQQYSPPIHSDSNGSGENSEDDEKKQNQKVNFGSSALERAAKAAKELENSKHAKEAFELSKLEEKTRQIEIEKNKSAIDAQKEQFKIEQVKLNAAEKRKIIEDETKHHQQRSQYEDHLARKRHEDELAKNVQMQDQILKKQEESVLKQENLRRQTMQYEFDLREKSELKKIQAKYDAKGKIERENIDVNLQKLKAQAEESRKTRLDSLRAVSSYVGDGFNSLISEPVKMAKAVLGTSALALGIYLSKSGSKSLFGVIERRIAVPPLVRDTSNRWIRKFKASDDLMKDVIFSPKNEEKLLDIALSTKFTKRNGGHFRNLLFAGPPGTGKTLFAKNLAYHSGLDYAILSGGDITPLGANAVTALHKVFDWAEASRKGTLLFIDEADAFLKKRASDSDAQGSSNISEHLRSALNAFLFRTGTQSSNVMVILASNEPEQLDWAAADRVDEVVHFPLPQTVERERLVRLYISKYLLNKSPPSSLFSFSKNTKIPNFDPKIDFAELPKDLANKTEGFTGREISKLIISLQSSAYASENCQITQEMIQNRFKNAKESHSRKLSWLSTFEKQTMHETGQPLKNSLNDKISEIAHKIPNETKQTQKIQPAASKVPNAKPSTNTARKNSN